MKMFYFEFQSPHRRKFFVLLCLLLIYITIPYSDCLGVLPLKTYGKIKVDNETQKVLINIVKGNESERSKTLRKNSSINITNIEHTFNETSINDLDVSSSIKKLVSTNNQINR